MPIEDLARGDVVTSDPDTPVADIAATMAEEKVGSIVITDGDSPVGMVTDRDLAVRVVAEEHDPAEQTARNVMTEDVRTIDRKAGFYEATTLMAEHGVRRLPVCDGDTLEGIVTADDLNELLADEHQQFADVVRAQRPEY
jgi:signal-transduction protein with cAMP-binding, CBS, and nucleotidyltransferase domain